jgi:HSP20 family protein
MYPSIFYKPSSLLDEFWDVDRVFGNYLSPLATDWNNIGFEDEGASYSVSMNVPGMAPEDIDIHLENSTLTIEAEKKDVDDKTKHYGKYSKQVLLPEDAQCDSIEASCKHGVLELQIPKTEKTQPKRINIKG